MKCDCCEMLVFMVCGERQNIYVFSLYRHPNLDDRIHECILTSMAAEETEDASVSFLITGDLSGHHLE